MGRAMLTGWLAAGLGPVTVVDPKGHEDPDLAALIAGNDGRVTLVPEPAALDADFAPRVIVLAVKPQMMDAALPGYRRFAVPGVLSLSIAAGKTVAYFRAALGAGATIVRSMPNLPASIGRGATVAVATPDLAPEDRALADRLLGVCGTVDWVADEGLIDAVTAVSGGGPAYVFLLVECLAAAANEAGLAPDLARDLARQTVVGAAALLEASPAAPGDLRVAVTSPGGTTRAALDVLMAPTDGLRPLMVKAVAAAAARSRELGR